MPDDNTETKKSKTNTKFKTSYSNMSLEQAEARLGFTINILDRKSIPVETMLNSTFKGLEPDAMSKTKELVFDLLTRHILIEGYPGNNTDYTEASINDLVYAIINPVISDFILCQKKQQAGREMISLLREKEVISVDGETGGKEEFLVKDLIGPTINGSYIFVVEAKRTAMVEAMKQCLLSMKDMGDSNGGGVVFGFVTTGQDWRMLSYDCKEFRLTQSFQVVFDGMATKKTRWMEDYSIVVDCILFALSNGGIVKENVVVGGSGAGSL
ncbi:hypothetical protein EV426DRAFT_715056 [Tirmania nivea]|nr:hypothetical protein EV426DRAFT_715056 [Tirmania nivea]